MTNEERIDQLEKLALDQSRELMAIDMLLRSIILSHPNPENLRKALERASASFVEQSMEYGFSAGHLPSTAKAVTNAVDSQIKRWLSIFPA